MDAGVFIGALLTGDPRHAESRPLVEQARQGILPACTTTSILSEVYGALTWDTPSPAMPLPKQQRRCACWSTLLQPLSY
jgi:predicted nucleic acid-binding protein